MFRRIVAFEFLHQVRQPLFWAAAAVFAALGFVATTTDALQIGGGIGSLNRNAPYVVVRMLANLSLIGLFMVVSFVAAAVLRDFELSTDELVFSRPVRVRDLLLGRFFGSVAAACLCFAFASLGLLVGAQMPWLDPARVGSFDLRPHAYGLGLLAFPSFIVLGGLFFALASRLRNAMATYVALVALLVAYFAASAMFGDLESQKAAAWLDPFGLHAFELETRYWTVAEKNSRVASLAGVVLGNRLLWVGLSIGALLWAVGSFRYERGRRGKGRARPFAAPRATSALEESNPLGSTPTWRRPPPPGTGGRVGPALWSAFRLEARTMVFSVPFLLILAFGLTNVLTNLGYLDLMLGTPVWPVTYLMLLAVSAGYAFLLMVILTFFAGEMVWRERRLRLEGVFDALPVPSWVPLLAKLLALWTLAAVFIGAGMLGLMGFQLSHGYTRLEPLLYAEGFIVEIVPYLLIAVLALFFQVAVNNKFAGYLLMVLYLISSGALGALHYDHYLYRYASAPPATYSDLNGWGHYAAPLFWFDLYWSLAAGLLLCLACAGWVRGHDSSWRQRLRNTSRNLRGPLRPAALLLLLGLLATGGVVFYNTNVLNQYVPSDEAVRRAAAYERKYRQYREVSQPRIVSVQADVDIFPGERRATIRGSYRLVNRSKEPIGTLHLGIPARLVIRKLELPPSRIVVQDRPLGHGIYELTTPLAPGAEMLLAFDLEIANPGFSASGGDNSVVENGTFITSRQFPSLGYLDYREISDPSERRRQGLPPVVRMAKIDDLPAREYNDLARDADWFDYETTVSTSADQIAVAPGYLQREWKEGGRRFFHYKMDSPIPKFFAYQSGRFTVRRDSWQGVAIEVFHHPGHEYNVDRMVDAVRKTLSYMTENFSPYQHQQVRIVEFPRFSRLAASFPNTIPFSESIGFIARVNGEDAIDYPFYVTAHEVAHQWWGYQVLGADVQGASLLSETMAQYSALMVVEKEYGAAQMRRFLRYELDAYLSGRGGELVEEMPLELVENQSYLHYRKGSLVLYALKDYVGEGALNRALREYIASVRFQPPPYTVSRDLIAHVAKVVPAAQKHILDDLFSSITLFDLQAREATWRPLPDGRSEVTVKVRARKLRADGKGVETDVTIDDWIDVGVFPDAAHKGAAPLYLQKHHLTGSEEALTIVVDGIPARAGLDPYNKLIDRSPGDNVRAVTRQ